MSKSKKLPKSLEDIIHDNDYNNVDKLFNNPLNWMLNPDQVTTPFDENNTPNPFIIISNVIIYIKTDEQDIFIPCEL